MISQITIHNFGLIDRLSIEFCEQLNIFTGETGVGKSILIDALRFCLGERMNATQVRDSNKPCTVETVFDLSNSQLKKLDILSEYIPDEESILIINRTYLPDGRTKNKINGFTVTVSHLKKAGNFLVDFHGPHDHQMLLSEDSHIKILDRLCDFDELKKSYTQKYTYYLESQKKSRDLTALSETREREQDMLKYQIKELEQVSLDTSKYEELIQERARVNNAEKLYECACQLINMLENEQTGVTKTILQAFNPMKTLTNTDDSTIGFSNILKKMQEDSSDLLYSLTNYLNSLSFEPDRANEINRQYDIYYEILKKYGPDLEDANNFYKTAKDRYDTLINLEHNNEELVNLIAEAKKVLEQIAQKITSKREKTAKNLEETIEKELKELGILNVRFECRIGKTEITPEGQDKVVFYISPNVGESLKPLAEIISSGEAARVMLALKKALTKVDPIPVLIFDEIDAQIGGRLGAITGRKLKELSSDRQIILITHLPQIASFADYHFKVSKGLKDNRTVTNVCFLDQPTKVKELAKMMSGENETQIALKHANDMLSQANK